MRVTVDIEVGEISDCFVRANGRDFTHTHEPPETLKDFDVHEVWRMEFVPLGAEEALFDLNANWSLQEKLQ